MSAVFSFKYIRGNSLIHRLDSRTKILVVAVWTMMVILFYDLRVLLPLLILGFAAIPLSGLSLREVKKPIQFMVVFILLNGILTNFLVPDYAAKFVPRQTVLWHWGMITVTRETLFYSLVLAVRYLTIFPVVILFVLTTDPNRLAAGLAKMGVPYRLAFVFNIALRYLPTISHEFQQIVNAQRARGLAIDDSKTGFFTRVKRFSAVMVPLLMSSLDRMESVSNAMDLRCFGTRKERVWYYDSLLTALDYFVMAGAVVCLLVSFYLKRTVFTGLWLPF